MKRLSTSLFAGAAACIFVLHISPASAATETVLYSFCSKKNCADGWAPWAGLIDFKGTLYGTTQIGGKNSYDLGTVFSLNPNPGSEKVVYSFCSQGGDNCTDGAEPIAGLIDVKDTLYGTTSVGGAGTCNGGEGRGCGTVFSIDPSTDAQSVVHSFTGSPDGANPYTGSLVDVNGTLYGTTQIGGANTNCNGEGGCGTVFKVTPKGKETVLYSFCSQQNCSDGAIPDSGLINVGGTLYGTTYVGGTSKTDCDPRPGCGTVFSINPATGAETVLYSFCSQQNCTDGWGPTANLIDVKGTLYGTTYQGGANCEDDSEGCGTVFELDPATGAETVVYSFCSQGGDNCTDGVGPIAGLINIKDTLYGTTSEGGANCEDGGGGCGTVFSLDPATGAETVLYSFCMGGYPCADGSYPNGALIEVKDTLYGTTNVGGANCQNEGGCGTVFALKP